MEVQKKKKKNCALVENLYKTYETTDTYTDPWNIKCDTTFFLPV